MKIVTLLGSPRSGKNSATIAARVGESAVGLGAESRTFELNRLNYRGCQGCYACKKGAERCVVSDDLTEVLVSVSEADAVIMATPVYYGDITAQLKGFIDRTFSYLKPDYHTNPQPSRIDPKKLVFVLTQGQRDEGKFDDIFPRYQMFLTWLGFSEVTLVRACGIGPATVDAVPRDVLTHAEEVGRWLVA